MAVQPFVSDLGGNPEDRFSCNMVQIMCDILHKLVTSGNWKYTDFFDARNEFASFL